MRFILSVLPLYLASFSAFAGIDEQPITIPEPTTWALIGIGALGMYLANKRKR